MIMVHSNLSRAMKKTCYILGVAFGAALALVSCGREAIEPEAVTPGSETGNQVTLTINARQGTDSKTYIDGTDVKWATSGEKLKVFEEYTASGATDVTLTPVTSSEGTTEDSGATMTFAASFDEATADSYAYYAFYPSSAYNSKPTTVEKVAIEVKSTQTPTASSFDPSADILIAKPETVTAQATSLDMEFARVVAVGKMTLTGLTSSDPVTQVTFSATDADGNAVILAGRTAYNLSDASIAGNNTEATSIVLNYSALSLTANESMDVWFTCLPFSLSGAGSFKVVVETASETFTKDVSLSESQNLKFIAGKASRFTVDMSSVSGSEKAVDLCYAELTYDDFNAVYTSSSYGNTTITKTKGDIWTLYAANSTTKAIQLRSTTSNNDSYIKLPDFKRKINSVTLTLSAAIAADKTLTLETAANTYSGSIASVTTVADQTEYTFDLTSHADEDTCTTAYLRSVGAVAYITKVAVLAGTDTRTALDAPASVSATVDAETVNTINVSWEAVSGAASYTVTLTDGSSDDRVVTTTETSYSFTDLAYSTDYYASVVAKPSDYYTNKDSAATDSDVVSTGAKPAGAETIYYVLNTASTKVATSTTYAAYKDQTCASDNSSSTLQSATWSVTLGSMNSAGLWLGSNNKQKAKMILSNGSVTGASAIATALGVETSATYYAALICNTDFANISKVILTRSGVAGTAPSNVYLLYSTDSGTTYTLAGTESDAETITYTIDSPVESARYAIVIKSTGYCQYKVPVLTFYSKDN